MRVADKPTKETVRRSNRVWTRSARSAPVRTRVSKSGEELQLNAPTSRVSHTAPQRVARAAYSFIRTGPVVSIHVTTRHGRRKPKQLFVIPYRGLLAAVLLVIVCGGLWVSVQRTQADVVFYSPATCLGGWANPTHAQGEVEKGQQLESGNSALYAGGTESLYCGNFIGSEIEGVDIQSATLRLVWGQVEPPAALSPGEYIDAPVLQRAQEDAPETAPVDEVIPPALPTEVPESKNPDVQPAEPEVLDAPTPAVRSDAPLNEPLPEAAMPAVQGESTFIEPDLQADVSAEQTPALPEPQSYMPSLIRTAHAQELLEPATAAVDSVVTPTHEEVAGLSVEEQSTGLAAFSLRYSLDGATWTEFGSVSMDKFGVEFTLPLHSVEDIRVLQVGIVPIGSMHLERPILLNGMVLELRYITHDKPVAPDPAAESLLSVESMGSVSLVKTQNKESKQAQLWVYDRTGSPQWSIIAAGNEVDVASVTLLVPGYAFWVSPDSRSVSAYNIRTKTYFSHSFSEQPVAFEERVGLVFEETKTVHLEAGQLVVRDAEGVVSTVEHSPELNAEIEQLFNPIPSSAVLEEDMSEDAGVPLEPDTLVAPETHAPVVNDGAAAPASVE
ncbi:MAG: hypothetical protein JNK33_00945 [Candidatus Doudnabacteria bacterium]|nr:hypothetical protein [Candidatus Doudnabacteria bacterium]